MSTKGYKIHLKKKQLQSGTYSYYISYYGKRFREYLGLYPLINLKTPLEKTSK